MKESFRCLPASDLWRVRCYAKDLRLIHKYS